MKKGTKASKMKKILMIVLIGVLSVAILLFTIYTYELTPVSKISDPRAFIIYDGERAPTVASALQKAGLIRDKTAFLTYLNFNGLRNLIKAGTFSLSPALSSQQVASIVTSGKNSLTQLVIPEGDTIKDIEKQAATHGISVASFEEALASVHNQAFLASKPSSIGLEGYLFPDSYDLGSGINAQTLVNRMLDNFGKRVGPSYAQSFSAEGLTLNQGVTLASIVEKEVSNASDRPIVAQIFLKRFHIGMSLGSDVTVKYASDLAGIPFNLNLNSPYNTRLNAGLPPGPICNPGLSAMDAVAHPSATSYLYFVTGTDGVTYYATTLAQHNQNVAAHLK